MKTPKAPNLLDNAKQKIARQSKELLASQEEVERLKLLNSGLDNLRKQHRANAEQAEARVKELEKARDFHIASVDHHVEKARGEVSALEEEVERLRNTINNHKLIPREQPEEKSYF